MGARTTQKPSTKSARKLSPNLGGAVATADYEDGVKPAAKPKPKGNSKGVGGDGGTMPFAKRPHPELMRAPNTLTTYAELQNVANRFAAGAFNLLILCGPAGMSKTTTFRSTLDRVWNDPKQPGNRLWGFAEGNTEAKAAYITAYQYRDRPLVLDDTDRLHSDGYGRRLLKQIGQTELRKTVSYQTKEFVNPKSAIPPSFETKSPVCLITNQMLDGELVNVHLKAVRDRATLYTFWPTPLEIHRYASEWFWDQEIYDYIAEYLPWVEDLTCRSYLDAHKERAAGRDWKALVRGGCLQPDSREYRMLEIVRAGGSRNAQVDEFKRAGLGAPATFFRWLPKVETMLTAAVPKHAVKGQPPEAYAINPADFWTASDDGESETRLGTTED